MPKINRAPHPPSPGEPRKPGSPTATKRSEVEPPPPTGPAIASSFPGPWKLFPAPCPHLDSSAPTVCRPWQRNIRAAATTPTPQPLPAVWFPRLCSPKASNIPPFVGQPPGLQPTPLSACALLIKLISLAKSVRSGRTDRRGRPTIRADCAGTGQRAALQKHEGRNARDVPANTGGENEELLPEPLASGHTPMARKPDT